MIRIGLAGALYAVALAGCALTPSAATQVTIAQGETSIDGIYNAAAQAFIGAEPTMSAAGKTQAKALFAELLACPSGATSTAQCTGYVALADSAAATGDATTMAAQIADAETAVAQIAALK